MALHVEKTSWHPGELAIHKLLHVQQRSNPTWAGLPGNLAYRVAISPLVAFGALDQEGRPWTTVWGGEAGFARPLQHDGLIAAKSFVDAEYDPVLGSLLGAEFTSEGEEEEYHITREELESGKGKLISGLSIDLATRDRVKLAGRLVAGKVDRLDVEDSGDSDDGNQKEAEEAAALRGAVAYVQIAMIVQESLGNCPKYLNKKTVRPHRPTPQLVSDSLPLPREALELLDRADLFFLSSTDGKSMDTNHRGGPPGFVRVIANGRDSTTTTTNNNNSEEVTLIYPEYSGNRLYQTLGNLQVRPLIGICVPDFATGDVLYLTGETKILVGNDAAWLLPHTKLAVQIRVIGARFVKDGLSFRGDVVDYSPYNPPVRRLAVESGSGGGGTGLDAASQTSSATVTATLTKREIITPTVARFTFRLGTQHTNKPLKRWTPGQHVTFDFSKELDVGWSHMRDDDPTSLNDDYVRTFTVSSVPLPPSPVKGGGAGNGDGDGDGGDDLVKDGTEMQITVRKHGPVTGLLWRWNLQVPLEVPVLGFGGAEEFRMVSSSSLTNDEEGVSGGNSRKAGDVVFIAAGVGITPMLAQAPELLARGVDFTLLWTVRVGDVAFAVDVLERIPDLGAKMKLFITGSNASGREDEEENTLLRKVVEELGCSEIVRGRITREAVVGDGTAGGPGSDDGYGKGKGMRRRYLLCTGSEMLSVLLGWLKGEDVVYESFAY